MTGTLHGVLAIIPLTIIPPTSLPAINPPSAIRNRVTARQSLPLPFKAIHNPQSAIRNSLPSAIAAP